MPNCRCLCRVSVKQSGGGANMLLIGRNGARRLVGPLLVAATSALLCVSAVGSVAAGSPRQLSASTKVPPGIPAVLISVAAVPHSSDAWTLGHSGSLANFHFFVGHLHHGHWRRAKLPKLGGRYAELNVIAAGSSGTVWLGGGRQADGIQNQPSIWRWSGGRFVAMKLPKMQVCACDITSISASSATNAWAVGSIDTVTSTTATNVALHWNGKKWSAVTNPGDLDFSAVSTSGPKNAWALGSSDNTGQSLQHWNGSAWSQDGTIPATVALFDIATSSPKLAYAVGEGNLSSPSGRYPPAVLRFNGTSWSHVSLGKHLLAEALRGVTMNGKSVWTVGVRQALHSTGGAWQKQRLGKDYSLDAVSAVSASRAYAVGAWTNGVSTKSYVEVNNGHSWQAKPSKF